MHKKSQSALEFISLITLVAVIVIIIVVLSHDQFSQVSKDKEYILLKDVALKVQSEITIASNVLDGYQRSFTIPEKLDFSDYNLTVNGTYLIAVAKNINYFAYIPNTIGQLNKGNNTIKKQNGIIYLNQ